MPVCFLFPATASCLWFCRSRSAPRPVASSPQTSRRGPLTLLDIPAGTATPRSTPAGHLWVSWQGRAGGGSAWAPRAAQPQAEWRRSFQGAAACPQQSGPKDFAVADLPGVFRLLSVTSFSFSEHFLPMAVWEIGSIEKRVLLLYDGEGPDACIGPGLAGCCGADVSPYPFPGTVPRSMAPSTVSSVLRNPIYTVRSHRVGPCSSPPIPREVGPHGLHPRYVTPPMPPCTPAIQAYLGIKPLYIGGLCMGTGLGRVALGPQGK